MGKTITDYDEADYYLFGLETKVEEHVVETSRWSQFFEQVVYDKASDKYYLLSWESGATEYQDVDFEMLVEEVEPYETTVIKYRKTNKYNTEKESTNG